MGKALFPKSGWVIGLTGLQALLSLSAPGQSTNAAWLHTTNRLNTPHFWSAVDASNGPVTVLAFGDSMADPGRSIQRELFSLLQAGLGKAGSSWYAYGFPANGAQVIDPSVSTQPLPIWWSYYGELSPGGTIRWEERESIYVNRIGVYWFAHNAGGQFSIAIATNQTDWSPPLWELDGWADLPGLRYTNFFVPSARYQIRATGLGGTNWMLPPEFKDTNGSGIHIAYLSRGGINLNRIFSYPTNLLASMIATLNPQLVVSHMKEIGDIGAVSLSNRLHDLEALWQSGVTNGDVVYLGTPYDYRDGLGEFTGNENVIWRQAALRDDRVYLDCMTPSISYVAMLNAGWLDYPADVHPNVLGNQALAQTIWPELGFFALRTPRQLELLSVDEGLACRWASVTNLNYELQASANLLDWYTAFVASGTGGPLAWTNTSPGEGALYRLSLTPR